MGLKPLDKIKEFDPDIPVVMLSQDMDVAISCMHHKAFDYGKSETSFLHFKNITAYFHFERIERNLIGIWPE
jgi:DNA-binding NtrC family response regulator